MYSVNDLSFFENCLFWCIFFLGSDTLQQELRSFALDTATPTAQQSDRTSKRACVGFQIDYTSRLLPHSRSLYFFSSFALSFINPSAPRSCRQTPSTLETSKYRIKQQTKKYTWIHTARIKNSTQKWPSNDLTCQTWTKTIFHSFWPFIELF